jgi:hypothetical protein
MTDRNPLNEYAGPIQGFGEALQTLRRQGACPPRRLPVVLAGSLRPHHRPDKAWVYDEANRHWLAIASPEPRRALIQRLLRGREPMWWRAVEQRVERALRAQFN